jgi:hypothetical protein
LSHSATDVIHFHEAFETIVSIYQERALLGGLDPMEFSTKPDSHKQQTGRTTPRPSTSDFICDVELAALRSLPPLELACFNQFYKSGSMVVSDPEPKLAKHDTSMRQLMGAALIQRGIFPLSEYLTPSNRQAPIG